MTRSHEEVKSSEKRISIEDSVPQQRVQTPETKAYSKKENYRKWSIVISLIYANFWMAASVSLQAPFFPREAELKGATPSQYGLVFGVFELVVIIMSPIYGKLIPKISPKFLITSGVLVGGGACCIFGVLDYIPAGKMYIAMAFVVRIFEGFGAAALMTASFTIIAAAFPENIATSFSLVETSFGFGLIVGPTIGGALYQVGGFLVPFVVNGGFLLMGCFILYFLLPNIEDSGRQEETRNLFTFLADGGILSYTFSIISSLLFIGFNAATLEPHLRQFDLKPVVLGTIFVITGGIYAITTPIWGRICDKGTDPLIIDVFGYTLTCAGILVIGPAPFIPFKPTVGTIVGSLVVIGLGLSAKLVSSFVGALRNTAERGFPDNLATYGMVSALVSTSCSIGAFIGPSIGGFLLENTGYKRGTVVVFALEVFFMFVLVAYMILRRIRRKNKEKKSSERDPLIRQSFSRTYSYSAL